MFNYSAPGAYRPEAVNLDHMPSFTFGGRYSLEKPNTNPGNTMIVVYKIWLNFILCIAPCAYETEKVNLDHTPSYTFGLKVHHSKTNDTPGNFVIVKPINSFYSRCQYIFINW